MAEKTIVGYIAGLNGWKAEVVRRLDSLVREAAPDVRAGIKWAQPVYESNGPFSYIRAFKNSVNFGFWRGVDLADPHGLLEGTGDKMRHIKIRSTEDIDEAAFADFVRQALALNAAKGDPTKG